MKDTDIVILAARYDGLGRRVLKTVTNSGDLDGTTVYYYNGHQIVETRDGSGNLAMQVYHGTRYIDEVVGLRVADLGRVYLHQDHNYNVTAMTDLTGRVLERYYYSPYGELEAVVDAHPFDYDDDAVVDEHDLAAATTGGDCWNDYDGQGGACKRLDANADREIDADDYDAISAYVNNLPADGELQRTPSSPRSLRGNPFGHQGLALDAEIASYQNRARQYAPARKRFMQRDPLMLAQQHVPTLDLHEVYPLYEYTGANPIGNIDPSGLVTCRTVSCNCGGGNYTQAEIRLGCPTHTGPTTGHIYLCAGNCTNANNDSYVLPDSGEVQGDNRPGNVGDTINHECQHTCQVRRLGGLRFLLGYISEWLRCRGNWYCNVFEFEAGWNDNRPYRPHQ